MVSPVVDALVDLFGAETKPARAMGSHQNAFAGQDEWLTPPGVLAALGPFDLDPCAPRSRPWPTAERHYTVEDNGLVQPWTGIVWLNPPYSSAEKWLARIADHGNGIALLFARTETALFHKFVWPRAALLLFLRGRLHFHYVDGRRATANAGAPSVLVAYGPAAAERLRNCGLPGQMVRTCFDTSGGETRG